MYDLVLVGTTSADIQRASALLTQVFGEKAGLNEPYLRWLYCDNPAGPVVGFNAIEDGTLAAHYATIPVVARLAGRQARGLLSLNTATHPAHQGKQLFTKLATRTFEHAASEGFEFVVGVANANSTPGFIRKLGFQLVSPLDARLGLGSPSRRSHQEVAFERVWDEAALDWRLRCPGRHYRHARSGADSVTVLAPTAYPGILATLARLPASSQAAAALPRARPAARVWLGLDPDIDWGHSLFLEVPRALRPSPLNLIYKPLVPGGAGLERGQVRFAALDFDAY